MGKEKEVEKEVAAATAAATAAMRMGRQPCVVRAVTQTPVPAPARTARVSCAGRRQVPEPMPVEGGPLANANASDALQALQRYASDASDGDEA